MTLSDLPDVAQENNPALYPPLNKVGMSGIDLPCRLLHSDLSVTLVIAKANIHVDIATPGHRGIHMSRLYKALQHALAEPISTHSIQACLNACIEAHQGISQHACLELRFALPLARDALISRHQGYKSYPVLLRAEMGPEGYSLELEVEVPYSSTCPCSAALSRKLLSQAFLDAWKDTPSRSIDEMAEWLDTHGSLATPHSQRSTARLRVKLQHQNLLVLPVLNLIDQAESSLKTAVQTAVKREDEQAFAALNGQNLMFCEDAARRLSNTLRQNSSWQDYWISVEHHESLHAHDATAVCVKGVPNGYTPQLHR